MPFNRRLQLLLEDRQHQLLEREAARRRTSVAALIRDAIDRVYAGSTVDRQTAAATLLEAEPMPVEDWPVMKAQMLNELAGNG